VRAVYYYYYFFTLGINVPEGGLKKLVKVKRLGMSNYYYYYYYYNGKMFLISKLLQLVI